LFATHFHGLTSLKKEVPFVANAHVETYMDAGNLILLYKVLPGPTDKSFGIHIAGNNLNSLR
jgi:DNA mismatch repair protein MutS